MIWLSDILSFVILLALSLAPAWLALRFNVHMLQLNTYINSEQRHWLGENFRKQWLLVFLMAVGIVACIVPCLATNIALGLIYILTFVIYRAMKRIYSRKKPLKFTTRVKRLIATDIILTFLIDAFAYIYCGAPFATGIVAMTTGGQFLLIMLANFVNKPIERAINNHYIKDAKQILEQHENLIVIGITGSYGKTSMKFFLKEILSSKFEVLATPESYNTFMGIVKTIRTSLRPTTEIFICEMGARYVGEIKEICDIVKPDIGVITSIGPAHLMTFGSIENIQKTKFELADALPKEGGLFLNADCELVVSEVQKRENNKKYNNIYWYSSNPDASASFVARPTSVDENGTEFWFGVRGIDESINLRTRLVGEHNVINLSGALAVATAMGVPLEDLKVPTRRIHAVPHRLELKKSGDITILDDAFNSNPAGAHAALSTLKMFSGVRVMITPGMVELGEAEDKYNEEFGKFAAACCDWVVLVGQKQTAPIVRGLESARFDKNHLKIYNTFDEAYNFASKINHEGQGLFILFENDLPDNYFSV